MEASCSQYLANKLNFDPVKARRVAILKQEAPKLALWGKTNGLLRMKTKGEILDDCRAIPACLKKPQRERYGHDSAFRADCEDKIIEMREMGVTWADIASKLDLPEGTVYYWARCLKKGGISVP